MRNIFDLFELLTFTSWLFLNVILFVLYGYDKLKAKYHGWRVPEKLLLGLGIIGGGPGGLLGMMVFRHKTKKIYFYLINLIGCLVVSKIGR